MVADNSTEPVIETKSGSNWTIDVTDANLSNDTTLKDFRVIIEGSLVTDLSPYTKLDPQTVEYDGTDIGTNVEVELRRNTPAERLKQVQFGGTLSSALWEGELNRLTKIVSELKLGGVIEISEDPYDESVWNNSVAAPTQNAVRDEIENLKSGLPSTDEENTFTVEQTFENLVNAGNLYLRGIGSSGFFKVDFGDDNNVEFVMTTGAIQNLIPTFFTDTADFQGLATFDANAVFNSDLTINSGNILDVNGDVDISSASTMTVEGTTTLNGGVTVGGSTTFNNIADFNSLVTFNSDIDVVGGSVTLDNVSTLVVNGSTTFNTTPTTSSPAAGADNLEVPNTAWVNDRFAPVIFRSGFDDFTPLTTADKHFFKFATPPTHNLGGWSFANNNTNQLIVPVSGFYNISIQVLWQNGDPLRLQVNLDKNSNQIRNSRSSWTSPQTDFEFGTVTLSDIIAFAPNDELRVTFDYNTPNSNTTFRNSPLLSFFDAHLIARI